jgi:hypothetical protein
MGRPISEEEAMAKPLRIEYPGALYHVTSRGKEQKDVFKSHKRSGEVCLIFGIGSGALRSDSPCLVPDEQLLSPAAGNAIGNLAQIMRHIRGSISYKNVSMRNVDSVLVFDGIDDYIEIPESPDLSVATTGQVTVSGWIRPDVLTFPMVRSAGYVHWMGKGEPGQHEWALSHV